MYLLLVPYADSLALQDTLQFVYCSSSHKLQQLLFFPVLSFARLENPESNEKYPYYLEKALTHN